MFRRITSTIRQILTAIVLLALAVLATEVYLRFQDETPAATVASAVLPEYQPWLTPSATVHHEMRRLGQAVKLDNITFATNSLGLRGQEPSALAQPKTVRIVVLGDDTILGPNLEDSHTVPGRLQQFLSKATGQDVEVINAGVPGYCPLLSWLQYRHQLNQMRPDIVILHVDMSDVADDAAYRRKLKQSEGQQICVNALLSENNAGGHPIQQMLRQSALVRLLQRKSGLTGGQTVSAQRRLRDRYQWTMSPQEDLRLPVQHAMSPLEDFRKAADAEKFRIVVSCSPVPWQVSGREHIPETARNASNPPDSPVTADVPFRIVRAVCEKTDIPFCSAVTAFRSFDRPEELYAADSQQLSSWGAALYAREIASMLLQQPEIAGLFSGMSEVSGTARTVH